MNISVSFRLDRPCSKRIIDHKPFFVIWKKAVILSKVNIFCPLIHCSLETPKVYLANITDPDQMLQIVQQYFSRNI